MFLVWEKKSVFYTPEVKQNMAPEKWPKRPQTGRPMVWTSRIMAFRGQTLELLHGCCKRPIGLATRSPRQKFDLLTKNARLQPSNIFCSKLARLISLFLFKKKHPPKVVEQKCSQLFFRLYFTVMLISKATLITRGIYCFSFKAFQWRERQLEPVRISVFWWRSASPPISIK